MDILIYNKKRKKKKKKEKTFIFLFIIIIYITIIFNNKKQIFMFFKIYALKIIYS